MPIDCWIEWDRMIWVWKWGARQSCFFFRNMMINHQIRGYTCSWKRQLCIPFYLMIYPWMLYSGIHQGFSNYHWTFQTNPGILYTQAETTHGGQCSLDWLCSHDIPMLTPSLSHLSVKIWIIPFFLMGSPWYTTNIPWHHHSKSIIPLNHH